MSALEREVVVNRVARLETGSRSWLRALRTKRSLATLAAGLPRPCC
mgnify:CR=1 FL=1